MSARGCWQSPYLPIFESSAKTNKKKMAEKVTCLKLDPVKSMATSGGGLFLLSEL